MKMVAVTLPALLLTACATFTPPQGHPVLDDRIAGGSDKEFVQFATTPERRVVLMNVKNNRACAEPSPDAAENLSYTLSAALSGKKSNGDSVDANVSSALQSAAQSLFTRTQGVQFFRDGMFALCLAYMNGLIEKPEYMDASNDLRKKASDLIAAEIPKIAEITATRRATSAPTVAVPPAPKAAQASPGTPSVGNSVAAAVADSPAPTVSQSLASATEPSVAPQRP